MLEIRCLSTIYGVRRAVCLRDIPVREMCGGKWSMTWYAETVWTSGEDKQRETY